MSEKERKANLATRIYKTLRKFQDGRNRDGRTKDAWLDSLNVMRADLGPGHTLRTLSEFSRKMMLLEQQVVSLSNKLIQLDLNEEIYKPMLEELKQLIGSDAVVKSPDLNVSDSAFTSLLACSEFLGDEEKAIPENQITEMIADLKDFHQRVFDSEINLDLKFFVCGQISLMVTALYDYFIVGLEALQKMRHEFIAALFTHKELLDKMKDVEKSQPIFKDLWSKFVKVSQWVEPINKLLDLPTKISGLISSMGG